MFGCWLLLLTNTVFANGFSTASVREDGVILENGKPFFPLGIYHDSLDADYYGDKFVKDVETIANAGFNYIHVSMDFTYDGATPEQSTAARVARFAETHNVRLGVAVYLKALPQVVTEQAKWPAILNSSLGDDFNTDAKGKVGGVPKYPPERLRTLNQEVKAIAPRLLTYSSGSSFAGASLKGYERTVDCLAVQCYPIGDGSQSQHNELEAMDDVVSNYWRLAGPDANKSLIVNPQSFAWDGGRWPTPEEARLQAWISLLDGARGLVWYSFLTNTKQPLPVANPSLWAELRQLLPELKEIVPFLTDGHFTPLPNPNDPHFNDGEGTWHAGYWTKENQRLIVAVNTHCTEKVEFDVPLVGKGELRPLFSPERYGKSLRHEGNQLRGKLRPISIEVYLETTE